MEESVENMTLDGSVSINITDCGPAIDALRDTNFLMFVYVMYSIIFATSFLGNGIICYIVITSPRMRTVTNYFIMNLAIGDILITLLCVPFSAISMIYQYWPFPEKLCPIVMYSQTISVFISAYTLVAISIDRYMAIMWPLRPRWSKGTSASVILFVWIFAAITGLPTPMVTKLEQPTEWFKSCKFYYCQENWSTFGEKNQVIYNNALLILQFIIPLAVLLFTYTSIALMIWCHRIPGEAENFRDQRIAKSKRKMVKMMITVVIVYTICWLPLNIFLLLDHSVMQMISADQMTYIWFSVHWFAMSHACYNPIIYCYMNARFRASFLQTLRTLPYVRRFCKNCTRPQQSNSIPLTSTGTGGTDSQQTLQRNNTYTTYVSMRRKNGNRPSSVPVRSVSMSRNHAMSTPPNDRILRRYKKGATDNEISI